MTATIDEAVWIPPGTYRLGSAKHYPEEAPVHRVTIDGFWIDRHLVTNRRFAEFVRATGYVTVAERALDPNDFPGAPAENLVTRSLDPTRTGRARWMMRWKPALNAFEPPLTIARH